MMGRRMRVATVEMVVVARGVLLVSNKLGAGLDFKVECRISSRGLGILGIIVRIRK